MKQDIFKLTMNFKNPAIFNNMGNENIPGSESQGYRSYEDDVLTGYMKIGYYDKQKKSYDPETEEEPKKYREPKIEITDLKDITYILPSGTKMTFTCEVDPYAHPCEIGGPKYCAFESFYHYIGNNAISSFYTPSIHIAMVAQPNYVEETEEDTSLFCIMSGTGIADTTVLGKKTTFFTGTFAGSIGCGCEEWGHTSPTRIAFSTGAAPTEVTPGTKDPETGGLKNDPTVMDTAAAFGTWTASYIKTVEI